MPQHSPTALKERFNSLVRKGFRANIQPHGSQEEIELKTLKLMKSSKERFNKSTGNKIDFIASNYLANMLSEEEYHLKEKITELKAIRKKTNEPVFRMPKPQEWYKKSTETKRLAKMLME